jgi:protein-L-isoaspartate(D-aspartate) O-methyltransferase
MDEMSEVDPFAKARQALVEKHITPEGITDKRVLKAFLTVPRHEFVLPEYRNQAYYDGPLPIGEGQVITQPSLAARMTQALQLQGYERVLEIGTGSGYQAAILSLLAREIYTIERRQSLAERAKSVLRRLGYKNVSVFTGDGTKGLPEYAPFDAIIITAGGPRIPEPLIEQLKEGGYFVMPIGEDVTSHQLQAGRKMQGKLQLQNLGPVHFVPLIGEHA